MVALPGSGPRRLAQAGSLSQGSTEPNSNGFNHLRPHLPLAPPLMPSRLIRMEVLGVPVSRQVDPISRVYGSPLLRQLRDPDRTLRHSENSIS
jgi:hypothetical protein